MSEIVSWISLVLAGVALVVSIASATMSYRLAKRAHAEQGPLVELTLQVMEVVSIAGAVDEAHAWIELVNTGRASMSLRDAWLDFGKLRWARPEAFFMFDLPPGTILGPNSMLAFGTSYRVAVLSEAELASLHGDWKADSVLATARVILGNGTELTSTVMSPPPLAH